jgi:hypothetical protein
MFGIDEKIKKRISQFRQTFNGDQRRLQHAAALKSIRRMKRKEELTKKRVFSEEVRKKIIAADLKRKVGSFLSNFFSWMNFPTFQTPLLPVT